jgi:hypothetical protein
MADKDSGTPFQRIEKLEQENEVLRERLDQAEEDNEVTVQNAMIVDSGEGGGWAQAALDDDSEPQSVSS